MRKLALFICLLILLPTTLPTRPTIAAPELWAIRGMYGEERPTIMFGTPAYSASVDFAYSYTGMPHTVFLDTYPRGSFFPVHSHFNGYSWRGTNDDNSYSYIHQGLFNNITGTIATKIRTVCIGQKQLAVFVAQNGKGEQYLRCSVIKPPLWISNSSTKVVTDVGGNEDDPDLFLGPSGNVFLVFTKIIGKVKEAVISKWNDTTETWGSIQAIPGQNFTRITTGLGHIFSPRVVEDAGLGLYVCFEAASGSNSDIYVTRWSAPKWMDMHGNEGYTNVSTSPEASHSPHMAIMPIYGPVIVWSEAYQNSDRTGIAYAKWASGIFKGHTNNPGFSFILNTMSKGSASNPSMLIDENGSALVCFDLQDATTYNIVSCLTYLWVSSFVNPINGDEDPGYYEIKVNTAPPYSETSSCRIYPGFGPNGNSSPVIVGIAMQGTQSDPFYMKLYRASRAPSQTVFVHENFTGAAGLTDGWLQINTYKFVTFHARTTRTLSGLNYLFIYFEPKAKLKNIIPANSATPVWRTSWWYKPATLPWQSGASMPTTAVEAIAIQLEPEEQPCKIQIELSDKSSFLVPFYYATFFVDSMHSYNGPYTYPDQVADRYFIGNVDYFNNEFFIVDPNSVSVDQGSSANTACAILNPFAYGMKRSYKLFIEGGLAQKGLFFTFWPESGKLKQDGPTISTLNVYAGPNTPATWYTVRVKCALYVDENFLWQVMSMTVELKIRVKAALLTAEKTSASSIGFAGKTIKFYITLKNTGDGSAHNVEIIDMLPRELVYVSSHPSGAISGSQVEWRFDHIGPGETIRIEIVARIKGDIGLRLGDIIVNRAKFKTSAHLLESLVAIRVQPSNPGCLPPEVELYLKDIGRGYIVKAGDDLNGELRIIAGCGPFEVNIYWGDMTTPDSFVVEGFKPTDVGHLFDEPGDYNILTTVRDNFGKTVNIYKHIRVVAK